MKKPEKIINNKIPAFSKKIEIKKCKRENADDVPKARKQLINRESIS